MGEIGYAPPPEGPTGLRTPNLWTWSIVMNARSRRQGAAWDFIEWATGRDFLLRSAFEGNMNPTRASVWDDPAFVGLTERWGAFYPVVESARGGIGPGAGRRPIVELPRYRDSVDAGACARHTPVTTRHAGARARRAGHRRDGRRHGRAETMMAEAAAAVDVDAGAEPDVGPWGGGPEGVGRLIQPLAVMRSRSRRGPRPRPNLPTGAS